ncbi:hypothetical protein [uncultured Campylobacter sp.]|uniref:hypothetical protein n=1 Tax=uncultured Campylobacter sp. TaxID=218934 RepID=UPI00261F5D4E|nr:hypothetical protein [uncultured Campylobacter sp.]
MDFLDSLKDIKKDMLKDKAASSAPKKPKKPNPNRDEFKDIFKDDDLSLRGEGLLDGVAKEFDVAKESIAAREKRLKDEFLKYVDAANIKKLND